MHSDIREHCMGCQRFIPNIRQVTLRLSCRRTETPVKHDLYQVSLGCVKNLSQNLNINWFCCAYTFVGPLFLASGQPLQHSQREEQYGNLYFYVLYRLYLARHHARWLAPSAPSRYRHICSGTPALETGKVLAILVRSFLPFH
jgi:hypothetical protein